MRVLLEWERGVVDISCMECHSCEESARVYKWKEREHVRREFAERNPEMRIKRVSPGKKPLHSRKHFRNDQGCEGKPLSPPAPKPCRKWVCSGRRKQKTSQEKVVFWDEIGEEQGHGLRVRRDIHGSFPFSLRRGSEDGTRWKIVVDTAWPLARNSPMSSNDKIRGEKSSARTLPTGA